MHRADTTNGAFSPSKVAFAPVSLSGDPQIVDAKSDTTCGAYITGSPTEAVAQAPVVCMAVFKWRPAGYT